MSWSKKAGQKRCPQVKKGVRNRLIEKTTAISEVAKDRSPVEKTNYRAHGPHPRRTAVFCFSYRGEELRTSLLPLLPEILRDSGFADRNVMQSN
jgi:hypothetical protein